MKKILFCDMDGTVIEENKLLHKKDTEMLHRLQQDGHIIAFNTGRNYQEALFSVDTHGFPYDYLVLNNGAHIMDKAGNEVFKKYISKDVGKAIIEFCISLPNLWTFFYSGNRTIGYYQGETYEHTQEGIIKIEDCDFMEEYKNVSQYDIIAVNQENAQVDELIKIQSYISETFSKEASSCLNTKYLDITPAGCSKGTGVLKVKELIRDTIKTYCVGDSYNDISMFEVADQAYTFHRATKDMYQHTHKQVDYVYEIIEDMLQ